MFKKTGSLVKKEYTCPIINARFVLIPAGTFMMGSPKNEPGRSDDERLHQVTISKPFYLQTTEVTQEQWKKVIWDNPSGFKGDSIFPVSDKMPVEQVSFKDVQKFIRKLNERKMTGKYRLPMEAEWEYACRAGSTTAYCFGDDASRLGEYAWYNENSGPGTHPVGQKKPNAWGLYDMHGNVEEWVEDWYGGYSPGSVTDPENSFPSLYLIGRGGCCHLLSGGCRSASRSRRKPGNSSRLLGFRLLKEPGIESLPVDVDRLENDKTQYNHADTIEDSCHNTVILDWLLRDFNIDNFDDFSNGVVTTGSGPIEESAFDDFLKSKGIDVYKSGDVESMVVGRQNCNMQIINDQLDKSRDNGIKIYSQEMIIAYLLTGNDPYENDNILYEFGKGHPTIEYLIESGFRWPKSEIFGGSGNGKLNTDALQKLGLLKYLGYTTGINGEPRHRREEILRRTYTIQIQGIGLPKEYLNQWGLSQTKERLEKMANTLASFARNGKKKKNPPYEAIQNWEEDLEWLKETYYKGVFTFQWPDTFIGQ